MTTTPLPPRLQCCPRCWRRLRVIAAQVAANDSTAFVLVLRCGNRHEWDWLEGADRLETRAALPVESFRLLDA